MTSRRHSPWQALVSSLCCLLFLLHAAALSAGERPNILLILADDWGWGDLSCHGHPYVTTPNIDRLAREGTDFHRFSVASGVCSPSRTAVITGHFPARYGIDGHFAWVEQNARRNMPDWLTTSAVTLPRLLQCGGYATAHYGKWHLSNDMIPDSPLPSAYGYDDYGAFNCAGEQMPVHDDADRTIGFIEEAVTAGKPFFINLWIHEPHTPFHVVPKYRQRFPDLDEPDNIYAAVLAHADDRIGRVLDALDRLDLAEETLVIFTSDNGPARAARPTELSLMYDTATGAGFGIGAARGVTGGRKGSKACLFEGGIGVPFIARWPGEIPAGGIDRDTILSAVDLLPTFCELAGVSLPDDYRPDGVSHVAALRGTPQPHRTSPLMWRMQAAWPPRPTQPYHWGSFAVVDDHWKLIANHDLSHVELYDLDDDPLEEDDLAAAKPQEVADILTILKAFRETLPERPTGNVFSSLRAGDASAHSDVPSHAPSPSSSNP